MGLIFNKVHSSIVIVAVALLLSLACSDLERGTQPAPTPSQTSASAAKVLATATVVSSGAAATVAIQTHMPEHTETPLPPTSTPEPSATPVPPTSTPKPTSTQLTPTSTPESTSALTPQHPPAQTPGNTSNSCLIDDADLFGFSSPYILIDSWGDDQRHCDFFLVGTRTGSFLKNVHALGFETFDPGGAAWTAILTSLDDQPIDTYLIVIEYDPRKYNSFTDDLGTFTEIGSNNDHNGQPYVSQVTWIPRLGLSYLVIAAANTPCTDDHCPAAGGAFALTYETESDLALQGGPSPLRTTVSDNFMIQNIVIQHYTASINPTLRDAVRNALRRWFSGMFVKDPTGLFIDYFLKNGFTIPWSR